MPKVMIGVFAWRRPDGSFLPSKPIYREMTEEDAQKAKENMLSGVVEMAVRELYGHWPSSVGKEASVSHE